VASVRLVLPIPDGSPRRELDEDRSLVVLEGPEDRPVVTLVLHHPRVVAMSLLEYATDIARSDLPAITHVDYSARIQTVSREMNPNYYDLLKAFERRTGCGVLVNTSFNVRGEPIVCTPADAYRCFMRTNIDYLVLGSFLLDKQAQKTHLESGEWEREYTLD